MHKNIRILLIVVAAISMVIGTVMWPVEAWAADESIAEKEEMPLGAGDLRVQPLIEAQEADEKSAFNQAGMDGSHYADFSFGSVQSLNGIFSTIGLYVDIPGYLELTGASFRISYTSSSLVLSEYSSLTYYLNGQPFYSDRIQVRDDGSQTIAYISIPLDLFKEGYNLFQIGTYVRLTDDEGCKDEYNGANWISIADTSSLRISFDIKDEAYHLSSFPFPYTSIIDKSGQDFAVTVSDAAQNAEMQAALTVMADLGTGTSVKNDIVFSRISQTDRDRIIYFGLENNTPDELLGLLNHAVPPTGGLIQYASSDNREYLLVIAREEDALIEAARLLCDENRVKQIDQTYYYVNPGDSQVYLDNVDQSSLVLAGRYTLKDILGHGASFTGPFSQKTALYLPVSNDFILSGESRFSFNIRYAENLDFNRSLMTVFWGDDIPLYSHQLTREGASGDTVTFAVPRDAMGEAATHMTIVFDLEIEDLDCTPRQTNMPWAYIAADSTLYLPAGEGGSMTLKNLPSPFQKNGRLNDVLLVLSDHPSASELVLAGRMMSLIGTNSNPYGVFNVIKASEFNPEDLDSHVIVVGLSRENSMIAALNSHLRFSYRDDMSALLSNDKLALTDEYASKVGTLQIFPSPYSENRAVLVASSAAEEGMQSIIDRISSAEKRWGLEKEVVLLSGDGGIDSFQFTLTHAGSVGADKPSFQQVIIENREPMLFLLVGLGSMVLVLLGVVLVLLRIRKRSRQD